ncbi:MAG TPA: PP2C family protein-serine/threonine phosphatase [Thermoanaerobaculia bacterium]|nr:PP2C family protein-serine/threonine phosphatase [Thermoanaerobaculia bacterium]
MRETSIDDLVQLPEALALQKHFDAKNFSRLRWLLLLVAVLALVGLAVAAATRVSALRVAFYALNLVAVLGFIAVYRERFFERHFRQILVGYFFVQMCLPELWTVQSGADAQLQLGGLFPLVLMAFRLRLLEHVVLYGAFWVAEALHWGPGGLEATGGAAAAAMASPTAVNTQDLEIGIAVVTAVCLIAAATLTQLDKRRFLAIWRREHSRSRERLRMREEIDYARKIQLSMLPQAPPDIAWLDLSAASLPATEVGGDYYDTFRLTPSRLVLAVADVSGHGLASGLLLSGVRSCLYLLEDDLASPEALRRLDSMVRRTTDKRTYVTLLLAMVDREAGTLAVTSAGHPPLLHYRAATGTVAAVGSGAPPLGTFADPRYVRNEVPIATGDLLVVYTDGVIEMHNDHEQDYGEERLTRAIARAAPGRTAREVRDSVLSDLANWKGSVEQADDITLVVARLR